MTRTQRIATAVLTFSALAVAALPTLAVGQDSSFLETRRLAEQGDAVAQFSLGSMYANGEGVPEDDAEAVRWFRMAAEQGHASAQSALGFMYDTGEGVPEDDAEAMRWYRMAAEQEFALAQFLLGLMYANGEGVPENYVLAYAWFNLAAAQGDETAVSGKADLQRRMTAAQIAEAQELSTTLFARINGGG